MRFSTRSAAAIMIAAVIVPVSQLDSPAYCHDPGADAEEAWYLPQAADFRPEYDQDAMNQRKQTWEQYWGWIKAFYEGNFLCKGWTDRAKGMMLGVKPGPMRVRVVAEFNTFGKDISKEWAKDSSVCKVSTSDLVSWGKIMEKAKQADDGGGEELHRAVSSIRSNYQKKKKARS
jgi:hypothetical protein